MLSRGFHRLQRTSKKPFRRFGPLGAADSVKFQIDACYWLTLYGFQGGDVVAQPEDVGGFGGQRFGLTANHVAEVFNGNGEVHDAWILAGGVGQRLTKGRFRYTIRQSLNSGPVAEQKALAFFCTPA